MHKSKKSVGLFLMDQAAIAGVGNIYRAEILFKVAWSWGLGFLTLNPSRYSGRWGLAFCAAGSFAVASAVLRLHLHGL